MLTVKVDGLRTGPAGGSSVRSRAIDHDSGTDARRERTNSAKQKTTPGHTSPGRWFGHVHTIAVHLDTICIATGVSCRIVDAVVSPSAAQILGDINTVLLAVPTRAGTADGLCFRFVIDSVPR